MSPTEGSNCDALMMHLEMSLTAVTAIALHEAGQ
jgi:hypothetical protein